MKKSALAAGLMLGVAGMLSPGGYVASAAPSPQRMRSGNDWNGRTRQKDKALAKRRKKNSAAKKARRRNR